MKYIKLTPTAQIRAYLEWKAKVLNWESDFLEDIRGLIGDFNSSPTSKKYGINISNISTTKDGERIGFKFDVSSSTPTDGLSPSECLDVCKLIAKDIKSSGIEYGDTYINWLKSQSNQGDLKTVIEHWLHSVFDDIGVELKAVTDKKSFINNHALDLEFTEEGAIIEEFEVSFIEKVVVKSYVSAVSADKALEKAKKMYENVEICVRAEADVLDTQVWFEAKGQKLEL